MQSVSVDEVKKLAELSRVQLTDEEVAGASVDLSAVLEHFEKIQNITTDGVLPADDMTGLKNVMREDIAQDGVLATPEELLKNATTQHNYIVVPGVFTDNGVS
ncbi:MAG: Asp-tRNA(Asn)/Glu-tRNA(Gln) amidotransferase subunit GatC [Candidatus Andersenbacteria bacterium]